MSESTNKKRLTQRVIALLAGLVIVAAAIVVVLAVNATIAVQRDNATHTVIDGAGRSVEVPNNPENIAAMDSFAGEFLVMIGADERIMGVPGGTKSCVLLQQMYPGLENTIQLSGGSVNIETLMDSKVDVVFVKGTLVSASGEISKLESAGIPYVVIDYATMEEQADAMRCIGDVCGGSCEERADALADYYEQTIELVASHSERIPSDERVSIYHSINAPLLTDGKGSLGADWVTAVGAIDVSSNEEANGGGSSTDYNATLEQIYVWDPDYVICNVADTALTIKDDARWAGLRAAADDRVCNLPIGATRWGQRGSVETYLAMLWLGVTVYPEQYADVDFKQTVVSYYANYLGIEVDDALFEQIMSGQGLRTNGNGGGNGGN